MCRHKSAAFLLPLLLVVAGLGWACRAASFGGILRPAQRVGWPAQSEEPRVELLYSYEGSSRPQGERGFLDSLNNWLVGDEVIRFVAPYGMALSATGELIVADTGLGALHIIDFEARTHRLVKGSAQEPLKTPIGVAVGPRGRLYVTDSSAARVHLFSSGGEPAGVFGDPAEMGRPTGIVYDRVGERLLIVDTTGGRILSYSLSGELLRSFGGRGEKGGQFNYPTNIAVDARGRIFVVDTMNFRVQIFSAEFERESSFGLGGDGPGAFARPKGIALDSEGHVYVVDALFDNVQIFSEEGDLLLPVGARGTGFGGFQLPTGIMIDGQDRVFIADSGNARIQVLQYRSMTP